jgi:hypothetical protein
MPGVAEVTGVRVTRLMTGIAGVAALGMADIAGIARLMAGIARLMAGIAGLMAGIAGLMAGVTGLVTGVAER